jgi:ATP-dependent DNA ligase
MGSPRWPAPVKPMLAVAGELPDGPGWAYEHKWDGVRAVAYTDGAGGVRLISRNDLDMSASYPESSTARSSRSTGTARPASPRSSGGCTCAPRRRP